MASEDGKGRDLTDTDAGVSSLDDSLDLRTFFPFSQSEKKTKEKINPRWQSREKMERCPGDGICLFSARGDVLNSL